MAFIRVAPTTGYATPRRRPCPARNRIARPANAELLTPPKYPANNRVNLQSKPKSQRSTLTSRKPRRLQGHLEPPGFSRGDIMTIYSLAVNIVLLPKIVRREVA